MRLLSRGQLEQAFALRPNETYLSNGWLEFFDGMVDAQLSGLAAMMSKSRAIKAHHALAIGCVGDIREACVRFDQKVRILHEPFDDNLAYATIRRINTEEAQLLELLAQDAWSDVRLAKPYVEVVGPWKAA
jgi:hypothetical protein